MTDGTYSIRIPVDCTASGVASQNFWGGQIFWL